MRYDLHSHSTASDGTLSPRELIHRASEAGLDGIALTDHDTVDGLEEAVEAGHDFGIEVIPGIELSIQYESEDLHVLGYWIDYQNPSLREELSGIARMREDRAALMLEKLEALGIRVSMELVLEEANGGKVGRPHVARALLRRGYVEDIHEAFARFIGNEGPAFVPKSLMDMDRGMELLHKYGAVTVFAHPFLNDYRRAIPELCQRGLAGLEVEHPSQSEEVRNYLRGVCKERSLLATAGSDFHEPGSLGKVLGSHALSADALAKLKSRRPGS
ncbi:MAG: PHP domain-containing protein [Candidatus Krumholzibacteria bacterium]|nr:PHP domain-containing protein [Candidatus Krumholzibacteria bacterium]MDP6669284.1 PHP domain-containing protein [Candidatus Krumholzibacteria bacterium]MDP7020750.1 PHP domain-containing protein [Candidatus Krumholzibacteria bacterium]